MSDLPRCSECGNPPVSHAPGCSVYAAGQRVAAEQRGARSRAVELLVEVASAIEIVGKIEHVLTTCVQGGSINAKADCLACEVEAVAEVLGYGSETRSAGEVLDG